MKLTRARFLRCSFVLAASLAMVMPVATNALAQFVTDENRCREDLADGSRHYLDRVLQARLRCQNQVVTGALAPETNCRTGRGDEKLQKRLRHAEDLLSNIGRECGGVNLQDLGFPGICTDATGSPFDTNDFKTCVVAGTNTLIATLFDYYFPPTNSFYRGNSAKCLNGSARDATKSILGTIRAREDCLLAQEFGDIGSFVDCRDEIQPYGPGTGDGDVDQDISQAYIRLLGAIPSSCADVQIDDLDYQSSCVDPTGGAFTIFDLKNCFFNVNRAQTVFAVGMPFPDAEANPVCGDGVKTGNEECDNGDANSDTTPNACRTTCKNPKCQDHVVDTSLSEQCDDGNTVDTDCCSAQCKNPVCGDGVKACNEVCDNGTANSDAVLGACKTDCSGVNTTPCGNGKPDPGEECDDGNHTACDGCSPLCFDEYCGDDVKCAPEECDDGVDNSDTLPNKCRTTCKLPRCGDGQVDDIANGEDCDDGNTASGDSCPPTCAICGNNKKAQTEVCDGTIDSACGAGEGCNSQCECAPGGCPTEGELVLYAGVGDACTINADCPVGTCDPSLAKCVTVTRLDTGWNGNAHNADINNEVRTLGTLDCPGHPGECGICQVGGPDPKGNNCRCTSVYGNDNICNELKSNSPECPKCVNASSKNDQECVNNTDCIDVQTCTKTSKTCSGNANVACSINSQCSSINAGTCSGTSVKVCSSATRNICTTNADCTFNGTCTGTADCACYFGSPFPLSSGGTPACVLNRFAEDISGTADVDAGKGKIDVKLKTTVFLGASTRSPCPTCGGTCSNNAAVYCDRDEDCSGGTCTLDAVHDDGIRGGKCTSGLNKGMPCDVSGTNSTFPAHPTGSNGGGYSLDCILGASVNISGLGLTINLSQTTGTTSLSSKVSCSGENAAFNCPCLQCSGDVTQPCNSDAECASQAGSCTIAPSVRCTTNANCKGVNLGTCSGGKCTADFQVTCGNNNDCTSATRDYGPCLPSTCSAVGGGVVPKPNACDNDQCTAQPDGTGLCTTGPDVSYCQGLLRANGKGIISCNTVDDCGTGANYIGPCGGPERRGCFPNPIVATGKADPTAPIGASTFCVPPTDNDGINKAAGLPGPGRVVNQAKSRTFCGSDPNVQYIPGIGGCPLD